MSRVPSTVPSGTPCCSILICRANTRVVREQKGTLGNESALTSGICSADGRHIAIMGYTLNANMWMLEDF